MLAIKILFASSSSPGARHPAPAIDSSICPCTVRQSFLDPLPCAAKEGLLMAQRIRIKVSSVGYCIS